MQPDPSFVRPCGAPICPQSMRCLRHQLGAVLSFATHGTKLRGCPMFIDVRGVALLRAVPISAAGATTA